LLKWRRHTLDWETIVRSRATVREESALARGNSNAENHITSKCVKITTVLLESRTKHENETQCSRSFFGIPDCCLTHESEAPECTGATWPACPNPITRAVATAVSAVRCQTQTTAGSTEDDCCRTLEAESRRKR
jgi:hypothetical protein